MDIKSDLVRDVINDDEKKRKFLSSLKQIIDPKRYLLSFVPNEYNIGAVKISTVYPIDWLTKGLFHQLIFEVWMQFGNVLLHLGLKLGRQTPI